MKIQTRLNLNKWFSLGAFLFIFVAFVWAFCEARKTDKNLAALRDIERTVFERIILRDDWLLHEEERSKIQWYNKTQHLRLLLDTAAQSFDGAEAQKLLKDAKEDFEATAALLPMIMDSGKIGDAITQKETAYTGENKKRIISQIFLRTYSLSENIDRLQETANYEALMARNRLIVIIIVFVFLGIAAIVINAIATTNILTKGVRKLKEGLAIIGDGNLEHRFSPKSNDELSDLAKQINSMTEKLRQSYTSIDHLNREITDRKKAEQAAEALYAHQQALLAAIPDIITETDKNKIYTWANKPGFEFFGADVIGKEASFYFEGEQDTYAKVEPLFRGSEEAIYVESWQRRKDGQKRLLAWWCRVLKDENGNVTGALSSARDITDRKLAEEEIRKLNEELELRVARRTAELTAKTAELERINKVFVDRELRMKELKQRIAEMEKKS